MAQSYSVEAILSASDSNFTSTFKSAANSLGNVEKSSGSALNAIKNIALGTVAVKAVSAVTDLLVGSVDDAVARYDTLNRYPTVMENLGFSTEEAAASTQKLSDGIQGLPTALNDIVSSTQRLVGVTGDLDSATDTTLALNDALIASGSTAEEASRGVVQYTQMLSSGTVDIVSWRTLQETMSSALIQTAKSLGIASGSTNELYDALQAGTITFDELNAKLIELDTATGGFADQALDASAGIGTAFTNMGIHVVQGVTAIIESLDAGLSETRFKSIENIIDTFGNAFKSVLLAVADTIGPVVSNIDKLTTAITFVATAFAVTKGIKAWQTAVKKVETAAGLAGKQGKTLSQVIKSTDTATLKAIATQKAKTAQDKRAEASALSLAAATAKNKAETLAEEAAKTKGAFATVAQAEADAAAEHAKKMHTTAVEGTVTAIEAEKAATQAQTAVQAAQNTQLTIGQVLVGVFTGQITAAAAASAALTAAQHALSAAMSALPGMIAVTAISALVSALPSLISGMSSAKTETKEYAEALKEARDAQDDLVAATEKEGKSYVALAKKISAALKVEGKSADKKAELTALVAELNDYLGDIGLTYDETSDSINMTTDELIKQTEAFAASDNVETYSDSVVLLTGQEAELEKKLSKAKAALDKAEEAFNTAGGTIESTGGAVSATNAETAQLASNVAAARLEYNTLTGELEVVKGELDNASSALGRNQIAIQTAGNGAVEMAGKYNFLTGKMKVVSESLSNTYDTLTEDQQSSFDTMVDNYTGLRDSALDVFNVLDTKSEISLTKMTENLEANQLSVAAYWDNVAYLYEHGGENIAASLSDGSEESMQILGEFVNASEEEQLRFIAAMEAGATVGSEEWKNSLRAANIPESVIEAMEESATALDKVDWEGAAEESGEDVTAGLALGITGGVHAATAAVNEMAGIVKDDTKSAFQIGSPSKVYDGYGGDLMDGLANGIFSGTGAAKAAIKTMSKGLSNVTVSGLDGIVKTFTSAFSGANSVVSNWGNTINKTMYTALNTANASTASAMSTFKLAISAGMSAAQSTVKTGASNIVAALNMYARMYSMGRNAMAGLKTGLIAGAPGVYNTATTIANNVANKIAKALEISSPSRVLITLGEFAMQGFAIGLENIQRNIDKIVSDTAAMVESGLNAALDAGNVSSMVTASISTSAGEADGRMDRLIRAVESGQTIIMDTGELVGATFPSIDQAGGRAAKYNDRWGRAMA